MTNYKPKTLQAMAHRLAPRPGYAQQTNEPKHESIANGNSVPRVTAGTIRQLWARMGAIYGHKWISSYGESDTDGTWLTVLGDLQPMQIKTGCERTVTVHRAWPPTLIEFRDLCTRGEYACAAHAPMLPRPKWNGPTETGLEAISTLKRMLRGTIDHENGSV